MGQIQLIKFFKFKSLKLTNETPGKEMTEVQNGICCELLRLILQGRKRTLTKTRNLL